MHKIYEIYEIYEIYGIYEIYEIHKNVLMDSTLLGSLRNFFLLAFVSKFLQEYLRTLEKLPRPIMNLKSI